ncbi:MAG: hypothetical protein A3B70_01315 [Deltaproteobacteria bacterium RIFCSPHIGHO2_02_FULL_40_11]|nr:MAG: hypothetical protein A3B70_01315 [Deltaproteobacteria bacterium RIFCSPHIGHO2_02_FULL_40_11]
MTDLPKDSSAPDFKLGDFQLTEMLKKGSVLLAFYKPTCPTCQFAFPYIEKIHTYYGTGPFQVIGISQEGNPQDFSNMYSLTFPILSDTETLTVSSQYKLIYVPTFFLVAPDRKIDWVSIGFQKEELKTLCEKLSKMTNKPILETFHDPEVPKSKMGCGAKNFMEK